jgi:DNA-binding SARP family transcriptional activator
MSNPTVLDPRRSAAPTTLALDLRPAHFVSGASILPEGALADGCDLIAAGAGLRAVARPAPDPDGVLVPALSPLPVIPVLHIQLLGSFRLSADHTPVPALASPRLQALLAYLLLHRAAPHARAHLAFQLWPDTTEPQAHANLRTLLHRLRQALPHADHFLHADAQAVQWRADAPATLDVAAFERALAEAQEAEQHSDQPTLRHALVHAVEGYRGDLLPGWYDDWVLVERERLLQRFLTALEQLILLLEQAGEYAAAIGYAQQLLRHDLLHEAAYQHLMRLHALSGNRASALRVYHTCVTVLERELGVAPGPATSAIYAQLLRGNLLAAPPVPPTAQVGQRPADRNHVGTLGRRCHGRASCIRGRT